MTKHYNSPFKINLGLEVLSKRPDGYHDINTVFYRFDDPHDILTVEEAEQFTFSTNDGDLPTDERNLVVRAFSACAEYRNTHLPKLRVHLEKHIPSGAGLGGGSGNAATAIRIYSELVDDLSPAEQLEIGAKLGADVPFFLHNHRAMRASGIGEILEPLDFSLQQTCVIVKPKTLETSTTESYAGLKISEKKDATDFGAILAKGDASGWERVIVNDFESLVFQRYPELESIRNTFLQYKADFTLMSGSGGASYGLFRDDAAAERAVAAFRKVYPDGFITIAK